VRIRQGEVWWANLAEPLGWRPVLVLTRDSAINQLHWVTVAPLTRTIRGVDSEVVLEPEADGVADHCAVTLDNIATIEQMLLVERLASLSGDKMNEVWEALHFAFDLPF
jgi:mRNA interferase MazF